MRQDRGHEPGKAKTVGQDIVRRILSEFGRKVATAVQHLPQHRFGRGHDRIRFFDLRSGDLPAPGLDVGPEPFEMLGIVFLHHLVADRPRKVKHVAGIGLKQPEILFQGVL